MPDDDVWARLAPSSFDDPWAFLAAAMAELEAAQCRLEERIRLRLRCVECGREDDGARGWTLRLDEEDELQAFCPDCDEREFG